MKTIVVYQSFAGPIDVVEQDGGDFYDIFDCQGTCLNEGAPFYEIPSEKEVMDLVVKYFVGSIKGK